MIDYIAHEKILVQCDRFYDKRKHGEWTVNPEWSYIRKCSEQ